MDPLEPTSLVFLNRVLDRRHNEAAPAWTLHLVLHVPLLYVAGLSRFRLRFVHHCTTVRTQPFAQRSRAICSRPLGDASNHASREELRSSISSKHRRCLRAFNSAVERLGSFPSNSLHKTRHTSITSLHTISILANVHLQLWAATGARAIARRSPQ